MITGNNNIVKFLQSNDANYWKIKRSEKSEVIIQSDEKDKQTNEEAVAQFTDRVNILDPGQYFIEAYTSKENRTNWKKDTIYIKDKDGNASSPSVGSISPSLTPDQIGQIATDAVEKYKREEYYKQLEARNKELEENANALSTRFMERIEPIIGAVLPTLLQSIGLPVNQVAGVPKQQPKTINTMPQDKEQVANEINQRVEKALTKWVEIDPEAIDLLEKIVDLAERDPKKYNMAKMML